MARKSKSKRNKASAIEKPIMLAAGEATGHHHVLTGGGAALLEDTPDKKVFEVKGPGAKVVHEEHKVVEVPPGQYESYQVTEYDHFAEEARRVSD